MSALLLAPRQEAELEQAEFRPLGTAELGDPVAFEVLMVAKNLAFEEACDDSPVFLPLGGGREPQEEEELNWGGIVLARVAWNSSTLK